MTTTPESGPAVLMALGGDLTAAELLDEIRRHLTRYVVLPSDQAADAVALWVMATHAQPSWEHATRLAVISPEKRCGKSRLLDIIEALARNPLMTVNISSAALVRCITEDDPPTLLLDEADTVLRGRAADQNEDLRGILNGGYQRGRAYRRWDATARRMETCPTFAMAALASIGDLPDTIMDRSVVVRMRRRAPGETLTPFRTRRDVPPLRQLAARITRWGDTNRAKLQAHMPDLPPGVDDRAFDIWEPLVSVADHAGEMWPRRARAAALWFAAEAAEDIEVSLGVRLLGDIRDLFTDFTVSFMGSTDLVARLKKLDESPWYERDLTVRRLALMLADFRVHPGHNDARTARGYRLASFADAFERYL